jgi:uncharacterized cupin superfamily protein
MPTLYSSSFVNRILKHAQRRGIQTFASGCSALQPRPIAASCIEEGAPVARCRTLTESPDKRLSSGLWECSAGKFKVIFALDEIVHILEGGVEVREEGTDAVLKLDPGDAAYFPMGLVTHWNVPRFVKKFFVVRVPGGNPYMALVRQRLGI